jgi:methionine-gamma-lyase
MSTPLRPQQGISTLVNHVSEGIDPNHAHVTPIYQTSSFSFPDVDTGAGIFRKETPGYYYTRVAGPNLRQLADKVSVLEGLDLLRAEPQRPFGELVSGVVFGSGMAAVSAVVLSRLKQGQTIISQEAIYSATFNLFTKMAPDWGIQVVLLNDRSPAAWEQAFGEHPEAVLAYAESPSNPTLALTDLAAVAEIAHRSGAWLAVDNTFASPYCQRPLSLGADIVLHSTTKYLSGHGAVIGGVVVSRHPDYVRRDLARYMEILGGSAGPFDAWLTVMGLKTFELRMQRHCQNGQAIASFLESHPAVAWVNYPGLASHPQHELACRQMIEFGGMLSFELKGGLQAGIRMMNRVKVATLVVSLGNVDTLISHPASMTHSSVARPERLHAGITDGLVRLSVGIENVADLIEDLDQAMAEN